MNRAGKLILAALLLTIAGFGVYSYFFTAESQSNEVVTYDPQKAEMIRSIREGARRGEPPQPGPPPAAPAELPSNNP